MAEAPYLRREGRRVEFGDLLAPIAETPYLRQALGEVGEVGDLLAPVDWASCV